MRCTVEDNGIGRKKAAELGRSTLTKRSSSGLQTTQERLAIYGAINQKKSTLQSGISIKDLLEENGEVRGTLVEIKIYYEDFNTLESYD